MAAKKPDPYAQMDPKLAAVMRAGDKARADPAYAERQRRAFGAGTVQGTNFGLPPTPRTPVDPADTSERREVLRQQQNRVAARQALLARQKKR